MNGKKEIEMFVAGLVMDPDTNAPIVILKDEKGDEGLPIWIGVSEASSIATALKQVELARPMTHDLLKSMLEGLGGRVLKVVIHGLEENTFIAAIEVVAGETIKQFDSRPSDAIAVAVRAGAPIFVTDDVLNAAKVRIVSEAVDEGTRPESTEIENSSNEQQDFGSIDKDKWAEILDEMDPDDFKYKM